MFLQYFRIGMVAAGQGSYEQSKYISALQPVPTWHPATMRRSCCVQASTHVFSDERDEWRIISSAYWSGEACVTPKQNMSRQASALSVGAGQSPALLRTLRSEVDAQHRPTQPHR